MHTKNEVLKDALSLPPVERAELIEELLSSFDFPDRERIDSLWAAEAEDRIDAYERGKLAAPSLESVFETLHPPARASHTLAVSLASSSARCCMIPSGTPPKRCRQTVSRR